MRKESLMNRRSRGTHPMFSMSILAGLTLVIALVSSSCQSVSDWWKGDFNVLIEGTPDDVVSVYFILGKSAELEAEIEEEEIVELVKQKNQGRYYEFAEFHPDPDPDKTLWERGQYRVQTAVEYFSETYVSKGYLLAIEVHRPEFRDHEKTAIAIVVCHASGLWGLSVITEHEFHNMEQVSIRILEDSIEKRVYPSKTTNHRKNSEKLEAE
jgi:hypothetical protein